MVRITFWATLAATTMILILAVSYGFHARYLDQLRAHRPKSIELAAIAHVPAETLRRVGQVSTDKASSFVNFLPEKPPSVIRIGAFGDSFTHGNEVDEDHDYPSQLARLLAAAGYKNIEVLNFGSGWHGFHQTYIVWDEVARQFDLDYILLGPLGFWPYRELRLNHSVAESPYYIHSRFILKNGDLEMIEVDGADRDEIFDAYFSFIPSWDRLRYDRNPPSFLAAMLPAGRTLANPFYYDDRDETAEAMAIDRILLERLRESGTPVILTNYNRDVIRALEDLAGPDLCILHVARPTSFPYRAPEGHNGPSGNDLLARQYMALLTGRPVPYPIARYRPLDTTAADLAPLPLAAIDGVDIEVDGVTLGAVHTGSDAPRSHLKDTAATSLLALASDGVSLLDAPLIELDFPIGGGERATLRFTAGGVSHEIALGPVQRIHPNLDIGWLEVPGLRMDWDARLALTEGVPGYRAVPASSVEIRIGDAPVLRGASGRAGLIELRPVFGAIHHAAANQSQTVPLAGDDPATAWLVLETEAGPARLPVARQQIKRSSLDLADACPGFPHLAPAGDGGSRAQLSPRSAARASSSARL